MLVPLDDASVLPIVRDQAQPMWKRAFAAGWASELNSPESSMALAEIASAEELG